MNSKRFIAIVGLLAVVSLTACEKENSPRVTPTNTNNPTYGTPADTEPDNTAKNKIDRSGDTKTPFDQSESRSAIKITAEIRRVIIADDSLSVNAKNCKIMTDESGVVTLRGVVASQAEKDAINAKAKAIAGVTQVENQLEVKTN